MVFFDDDVEVGEDVLKQYASAARGLAEGAFFGGSVRTRWEEAPPEWLLALLPPSAKGLDLGGKDCNQLYLGFNWAAFAEDIIAAGGFDPNFGPGSPTGSTGQESQMQRRLLGRGCRMINVPEAVVTHYVPQSRCNPAWAVRRAFRNGIGWGRAARARREPRFLLNNTLQMLRCYGALFKKMMTGDDVGMWRARAGAKYHRGLLRGYFQPPAPLDPLMYESRVPKWGDPERGSYRPEEVAS